jgi:hypothetical protein
LQDRDAFASPGESDSLAIVARALAGYPKSSNLVASSAKQQ